MYHTASFRGTLSLLAAAYGLMTTVSPASGDYDSLDDHRGSLDLAAEEVYAKRAADWRNGAIVYQVLVDRFAPSADLDAKRDLYTPPRTLHSWDETPAQGEYLPDAAVWSHEIAFWGGDLKSLRDKLDYIEQLGVDVLYLNPIFESFTNHKYDAYDYMKIAPEFGTRQDLRDLADELHRRGMYLVLDGVFNHMGRKSPYFQEALADPESPWREFYTFNDKSEFGYVGWWDVENLPEVRVESKAARDYLYAARDSVVQSYLREEGVDGWRLDVGFDLGMRVLGDLTNAAHTAKPGSLVVGEIYNYPEGWFPAADAVMNMHGRVILLGLLDGTVSPPMAARMWQTMIDDAGLEPILKSWVVLENHDWPRLNTVLPEPWKQRMARILQFTVPGSLNLYYGGELGMEGGGDPEQRAPMRWDLVNDENETLQFHRDLLELRKTNPALRYGDFRILHTEKLFAFLRYTNRVREAVIVLANPAEEEVTELIQLRYGKFQDAFPLVDVLSGDEFAISSGTSKITVPAGGCRVLKAKTDPLPNGYDRYDRLW